MSMPSAAEKYREAIELYRTTDLTLAEISRRCKVNRSALAAYIYRCHRDLMLRRHGMAGDPGKAIWKPRGQRAATHRKYREAIEACDSEEFINLNVSQIARKFHLDATALANQLRTHYPDILQRREAERRKRGIADNAHRGVRKVAVATYAEAVKLLHDTDMTIEEVADKCGVSFSGLRQHLTYYHKDIIEQRSDRRCRGKRVPKIGSVSGSGRMRVMSAEIMNKYAEGVELYKTTSLPVTKIAKRIGLSVSALRHHLKMWHTRLMFERRGARLSEESSDRSPFDGTKRYSRATVEKYAEAIELLKTTEATVESVAKRFGFVPEVLRAYLKEHEPELFQSLGMMTLPNGRLVLKRSYDKYRDAIEAYATTPESLKSIALRYNIAYNSLGGFIRRSLPELIPQHKKIASANRAR